jgi:hypothetical protein
MIIAALLLMQAAPVAEAPPCRMLRGGIAAGMCAGSVEPDDGDFVLVSLLPAPDPGPAIPPEITKTLDRLLKTQARGVLELPKGLLAEGATARFCTDWTEQCMQSQPLTAWPLGVYYTPNRPYLLDDGRVRIEWMLGVKLDYMSLITFEGKKVKSIDTTPATIPMAKPAPAARPPQPAKSR